MKLLLVTGSRALCDTPEAGAWAMRHLVEAMRDRPAMVVTGDAGGPDTWARTEADAIGIDRRVYALDGWVYAPGDEGLGVRLHVWCHIAEERRRHGYKLPLERNRVMVTEAAAYARQQGLDAVALPLCAPWSRTNGTAQTVSVCRRVKLPVMDVAPCPRELGGGR